MEELLQLPKVLALAPVAWLSIGLALLEKLNFGMLDFQSVRELYE